MLYFISHGRACRKDCVRVRTKPPTDTRARDWVYVSHPETRAHEMYIPHRDVVTLICNVLVDGQ